MLLPQLTTARPHRPVTTPRMKPPLAPLRTPAPTVVIAGPNVSPTRPPKPPVSQGILPSPPRPTVEAPPSLVTQAPPPKSSAEEEKSGFPKTVVISCVAIGLIVMLILVVFLVFKCRHKSSSGESYSTVDETKQYTNLNTTLGGGGNDQAAQAPEMAQSRSFLSARVTQVNGFSRTGKKKDVKEWYV